MDAKKTIPLGTFDHCLKTKETSGLEPDTVEFKFYAPGVGLVFINDVSGPLPLVKITTEGSKGNP